MLKWGKLIRRTDLTKKEDSWVTFSTDGKWDIIVYKLKNPPPTHYYVEVRGPSGHLLWNWRGVDKNKLIAHAKKVLNSYLYPEPNKTKIYPKQKETKVAKWNLIVKRNQKKAVKAKKRAKQLKAKGITGTLARVKSLLFKQGRRRASTPARTNTRYVGRISKGKYMYRVRKA